jgi:hypothetical protein
MQTLALIAALLGVPVVPAACVDAATLTAAAPSDPHEFGTAKNTTLLIQLGFGPEALAAAGMNASSVASFVDAALAEIDSLATQIRASDERLAAAAAALRASTTPAPTAVQELEDARTAEAALRAELTGAIASELPTAVQGRVALIRSHRHWNIATKYLVVERTNEEWTRLRQALAAARDAAKNQRAVEPAVAALISSADAATAVAAAAEGLTGLPQFRTAWTAAVAAE